MCQNTYDARRIIRYRSGSLDSLSNYRGGHWQPCTCNCCTIVNNTDTKLGIERKYTTSIDSNCKLKLTPDRLMSILGYGGEYPLNEYSSFQLNNSKTPYTLTIEDGMLIVTWQEKDVP